jgi:acetylglutamate kinase
VTGPIVVKIGGTTLEDPKTSPLLWDAIAALAKSRREGVIVVHGGGKAVDRLLERLNIPVERKQGLRVTPPDQMDLIAGVLAGSLNKTIVASLLKRGVKAVGLCLGDGGAVPCVRKKLPDVDLGLVGEVALESHVDHSLLNVLMREGFVPILSSIGIEDSGSLLNINADDGAAGVAWHVKAGTLVVMTDVPGIMDENKRVIPETNAEGIEKLISQGVISAGMIPKARAAAEAARLIGAPIVILSGNDPASLADWSAGMTVGTRVLSK